MTARAVPILVAAAGLAAAGAPALAERPLSLEATSALLLQPATAQNDQPAQTRALTQPEVIAAPKDSAWSYDLDFIFWWPWDVKAKATTQNVTADIDVNPGDMFDHSNSYAPEIRFEAWNKQGWGLSVIGSYHWFDNDGASGNVGSTPANTLIDSEIEWYTLDVSAGFRLLDAPADSAGFGAAIVDGFAGVRVGMVDIEHVAQSNQQVVSDDDVYIEPIFGIRSKISIRRDLWWSTRLDLSGGGTAWEMTDLTWSIDTGLEYKIGNGTNLLVGYRMLDIDYDKGKGNEVFGIDGTFQGPYVGINLSF